MLNFYEQNWRARQIQQICEEKEITTLCHFTRIENLPSILQDGLLSRSALEADRRNFLFNDPDRADNNTDAVCLSISFPNYKMFYKLRKDWEGVEYAQWVVLLLDAKVLWEFECAFCKENAASRRVNNVPLENRKRPEALKDLFEDFYGIRHQDLSIPQNYPTHPQAEVLVFNPIPVQYIKEIHYWDAAAQERLMPIRTSSNYKISRQYFDSRSDYSIWKSENLDANGIPLSYAPTSDVVPAVLPVFIPDYECGYVKTVPVRFAWRSTNSENVRAIHAAASEMGLPTPIYEISTASSLQRWRALSAFNLKLKGIPIECLYQGSKVFKNGGPYHELYKMSPRNAKTDKRLRSSGKLIGFNYKGQEIPTWPKTLFFDWIYIKALIENDVMLSPAEGFTDLFFKFTKGGVACQARSAALWMAASANHELREDFGLCDLYNLLGFWETDDIYHPIDETWQDEPRL